jgi:acetyl-CoA carboxylase biotin carboxyl carrier protein
LDLKEINRLIDRLVEKGITEFELEREGFRIRICKVAPVVVSRGSAAPAANLPAQEVQSPAEAGSAAQATVESRVVETAEKTLTKTNNLHVITSPMVGTFYRAPSPGAKSYVEIGDRVKKGQVCCIVEAMKLMNEIVIDVNGVVAEVHPDNAQPVEFGEPLFSIEITH